MIRGVWRRYWRLFYRSFFQRQQTAELHRRHPVVCLMFLAGYPLAELVHAVMMLADYLIPGWNRPDRLGPPVFIVGNPRSGTTIAHRVLSRDEERFFFFRSWEIGCPSIWEKWFFAALGRLDRLIGSPWERLVNWYEQRALSEFAKYHQLGLFLPEEDDKVLVHVLAALDLAFFFPFGDFQRWGLMDQNVPRDEQDPVMRFYQKCVLRQGFYQGGCRSLLSKNPAFTGKFQALQRNFPDCKLIYMVRNPLDVVPSIISMMRAIIRLSSGKDAGPDLDLEVYQLLKAFYLYALEQTQMVPPDRLAVVIYDDLIRDPQGTFDMIYRRFGWTASPAFETALRDETDAMRKHKSKHRYSLEQSPVTQEMIRSELAIVFQHYGFDLRLASADSAAAGPVAAGGSVDADVDRRADLSRVGNPS